MAQDKKYIGFDTDAVQSSAMLILITVVSLGITNLFSSESNQYIVTDKSNNKILYRLAGNPNYIYTMTFDDDIVFQNGGFYPYINIGDTIDGNTSAMSCNLINRSWYYQGFFPPVKRSAIVRVNGRNFYELRETARRDSLIREMKQKQK